MVNNKKKINDMDFTSPDVLNWLQSAAGDASTHCLLA